MQPIDFIIIVKNHNVYVGQERKCILGINYWKTLYETSDICKAMSINTTILNNTGCNLIYVSPEYNESLSQLCPIEYDKLYNMTKDTLCFYCKC